MAREGLRIPLRTALHKAATTRARVVQKRLSVQTSNGVGYIDLAGEPIAQLQAANLYMILIEDAVVTAGQPEGVPAADFSAEEVVRNLESELRTAQDNAQAIFEELESSNEELKSAN